MPEGRGGKISHRLNAKNTGLRHQWFQACYPATDDGSYCLIVEDDLELSPFWFTWLRKAWLKYGDRDDIAGITLSVRFILHTYHKNHIDKTCKNIIYLME